ncbi:hypothetical protein [Parafrankia sp. BMG5.11]|uniref:hypothetical protein n=1 Tax=Parafrankia sp. BMG5.11 TaxID=222540 RepID=UPI0010386407|nr:hypothetical protein [Parafrankia sp. BMG5.11]TCJ36563.1 hypothetical protein E0504_22775 [Parafrankia sp. BMG5.11]
MSSAPSETPAIRWGVVTLDAHDRAVRVVVGFAAPQLAEGWACAQPGLDFVVVPAGPAQGSDWAVVALNATERPIGVLACFPDPRAADLYARSCVLSGYTVAPIDVW